MLLACGRRYYETAMPMRQGESLYLSEVLGIKSYLCPPGQFAARRIRGALPCRMLAVTAGGPSESQAALLKKIMGAIGFPDFTVLEVKKPENLPDFLSSLKPGWPADWVCLFGEAVSPLKGDFFFQAGSLGELEGDSSEAIERKKRLWLRLKEWRKKAGF